MDEDDSGKDDKGKSGNKSSQSIFPEIVINGLWRASLKLKYIKFTIRLG